MPGKKSRELTTPLESPSRLPWVAVPLSRYRLPWVAVPLAGYRLPWVAVPLSRYRLPWVAVPLAGSPVHNVLLAGRVAACYWRGLLQRVTGRACYSVLLAGPVTGWRGGAGVHHYRPAEDLPRPVSADGNTHRLTVIPTG